MEGTPISLDVIGERLRSFDVRIRSNHDRLDQIRKDREKDGKAMVRIEGQLNDQSNDIAEMKNDMKWIKRGLFGAIAVGLLFTVSVASLVVQVAS